MLFAHTYIYTFTPEISQIEALIKQNKLISKFEV
ncbi:hypothetical protein PITC_010540 [Penicillium italicum]|uniref:Uncharacterized protein n=1 Tax=Penicillium italicum TaxID=40296 RepID=A0A0A2LCG4_PENIT|nr:hypothetical protein PITC_010540 [Penicillium italicum]